MMDRGLKRMDQVKKEMLRDFLPLDLDQMRPQGFHKARSKEIKQSCEKVSYGKKWRKVINCPCCKADCFDVLMAKEGIEIHQCRSCTLGYAAQFPVDTRDVYCGSGYLETAREGYLKNVVYRMERFAKERVAIIDAWRQPDSAGPLRLLDVGCGTGWFLEYARSCGYEVFGQELGTALAAFTAQRLGIAISSTPLEALNDLEGFDVITLFDVLEHTPNPVDQMTAVSRLLKPAGIAIVFAPNLKSFGFSVLQEHSALVAPAEHLLYFTKTAMKELAKRSGLEIMDYQTKGMDIPDIIAYYRDVLNKIEVTEFLSENLDLMQMMVDKSGFANHMRLIFRKTSKQNI
jgi:2-polyprenyl-3-methyl-5-hydroxy-6-metoxy-1,4-benzoquinol methylase